MTIKELAGQNRATVITVILLSAFLNTLVLSGSTYMMLVYDMVIPSRNPVSLIGLLIMLIVAYAFQAGFDLLRSDLLRRAVADIYSRYSRRAYLLSQSGVTADGDPVKDLETIRAYLYGPGPTGLIDMPWMALYLGILFMLHIWLGLTAAAGIAVLIGLAWLTNDRMKKPTAEATAVALARQKLLEETRAQSHSILSLGMRDRIADFWEQNTDRHLTVQQRLATIGMSLSGISRTFRLLLQSLILTVGALLVINDKATGGIIFASSIIGARALVPIETVIATWKQALSARLAWARISKLPDDDLRKISLPVPGQSLEVSDLTIAIPGRKDPVLNNVRFRVKAGDVLAVVGPSAAGKTTLLRSLAGQLTSAHGAIRLDGASLDQWDMNDLGGHLGYLPQDPSFLSGSVFQNISRFDPEATSEKVIAAATAAGVHDMIVRMQDGYNALMKPNSLNQSGGQRQRISLARALYGDPFLVLLDEPNSNLDTEGEMALAAAIEALRERGAITIIASHRPAILHVATHVLVLRDGAVQAFGPKKDILPKIIGKNAA